MGNKSSSRIISVPYTTGESSWDVHHFDQRQARMELKSYRNGLDNPRYKSLLVSGQDATNLLVAETRKAIYTVGTTHFVNIQEDVPSSGKAGYVVNQSGLFGSVSENIIYFPEMDFPLSVLSDAQNSAAIGIRKEIKNRGMNNFQSLVFLGELRDSIRLIRNPASEIRRYLNDFTKVATEQRKRKRKGTLSKNEEARVLAKSWLEFSFGVAPLMNDIKDIALSTLNYHLDRNTLRARYVGKAEKAESDVFENGLPISAIETYAVDILYKAESIYLAGVKNEKFVDTTLINRVYQGSNFDLKSVIPAAWELVPWSFLIDYFTNIGDVLETSLVSLSDVNWSQLTDRTTIEINRRTIDVRSIPGGTIEVQGFSKSSSQTIQRRIHRRSSEIAIPQFRFELPGKPRQFFNMAALLVASKS